jgi:ADP-ribose pyrophosphatase YjhB (NUDIX family)
MNPQTNAEVFWSRSGLRFSIATYLGAGYPPAEFITSVRAVVNVNGKLVALRNPDGLHFLPGGRIERGETFDQALEREVLEETGLRLRDRRLIGFLHLHHLTPRPEVYDYPYPDMIHLVYSVNGVGSLIAGDPDGWEQQLSLISATEARRLQDNEYAYPFLDHIADTLDHFADGPN